MCFVLCPLSPVSPSLPASDLAMDFQPPYFPPPFSSSAAGVSGHAHSSDAVFSAHLQPDHYQHYAVCHHHHHCHCVIILFIISFVQASLQSSGFSHAYDSLRRDYRGASEAHHGSGSDTSSTSLAVLHANNNNQVSIITSSCKWSYGQ